MFLSFLVVVVVLALVSVNGLSREGLKSFPARDKYPQVIAHRGASGYVPEHSLQAYQLAFNLGTDYIEPDLCLSKDGVFVAMHDLLLDETTNVASLPQFADRKTTKVVDGKNETGYFISDFLYTELLELRLNQRLSQRTTIFNGYFQIPSLDQIIDLMTAQYNTSGIMRGIYPELKHPSFFESLGFPMSDMLLDQLSKAGFAIKGSDVPNNLKQVLPVVIQCFEKETLQKLKSKSDLPLIYLIDDAQTMLWAESNLATVKTFADGLGPNKAFIGDEPFAAGKKKIESIHDSGLAVVPWTFRADMDILKKFGNDFAQEQMYFLDCLGVDAVFTEFPDQTRESIDFYTNVTQIVHSGNEAFTFLFHKKCESL